MQIIRAADHRRMPWKNGGGETLEIAVHPPGAGLADFAWRVSMALVAVDGPFSAFPGIDRTLAILEGDGLELAVAGRDVQVLSRESRPWSFPGDAAAAARLTGGPIRDLNVMTRRGVATHAVERVLLTAPLTFGAAAAPTFVLCAEGRIALMGDAALSRQDVAAYAPGDDIALSPLDAAATAFLIRITPLA